MQLQTILNHVEKQKGFVYGAIRFDKARTAILVELKPHKRSRPICSGCGCKGPGYDRTQVREFEFVPLWLITVLFVYAPRRVNCKRCGVKVERLPWADGKHHSTYSYRIFLARWASRLSWKETASIFGTSWDTVFRSVEWIVRWGVVHREITGVEAIGIDEIAYKKGHKYMTLVYQIDADCKRLLYVARDRTEQSLRGFFTVISSDAVAGLRFICTDMWRNYMTVIAEKASGAVHILDRFHVMKMMNDKINKVRIEEHRVLKQQGRGDVLKGARWCLLKRPENLTDRQTLRMKELVNMNLRSVKAQVMQEDFQRFWDYSSVAWAGSS